MRESERGWRRWRKKLLKEIKKVKEEGGFRRARVSLANSERKQIKIKTDLNVHNLVGKILLAER